MPDTVHQFTLGAFTGYVLLDGYLTLGPTSIFFKDVPPDEIETAIQTYQLSPDAIELVVTCLLLERDDQRILIDAGAGDSSDEKGLGRLRHSLAQVNIQPEDITDVILTHVHFDHTGGIVTPDDQPTFPNATYRMTRGAYQLWTEDIFKSDPAADQDDFKAATRKALHIIKPQLECFDPGAELLPGVHAISTHGHTANHISVHVISGNQHLIATSDAIVQPFYIENPEWCPSWNVDLQSSQTSTRKLLTLANETHALVFCCHFPFPSLGQIQADGDDFHWQPQNIDS